jgi:uncharacterized protein
MLKKALIVVCLVLIPFCLMTKKAVAQQEISAEKKALIQELLLVTEAEKTSSRVVDTMLTALEEQYPLIMQDVTGSISGLTPAQRQKMTAEAKDFAWFSRTFRERLQQRINFKEFVEKMSYPLYDKYFTESELKDLISFYKSTTGKKTLSVMPALLNDSIQKSGEVLTPILTGLVHEMIEEEKARLKTKKY